MMRHHFKHRVAVTAALAASVIGSTAHAGGRGGHVHQGAQISQQQRPQLARLQPAERRVSDGALVKVISAANQGEIAQAKIALELAKSREVKDFAREMIKAHTQAENDLGAHLRRLGIKAEPTRASAMLAAHSSIIAAHLRAQPVERFDQEYIAIQVRMHSYAVRILDEQVIPRVKDQELKQELQRIRDTAASHLKRAQAIQATLAEGKER
ncbi:DUF4142 domain-containing protein [Sorangium sp. So ce693]|uniref:DUF4142 domain-containing protein n=1 Tax=Sorangium sp. So ce693 TaxID=3133318 RepID=UPI003F6104D8